MSTIKEDFSTNNKGPLKTKTKGTYTKTGAIKRQNRYTQNKHL
jgi:hypothetical protein